MKKIHIWYIIYPSIRNWLSLKNGHWKHVLLKLTGKYKTGNATFAIGKICRETTCDQHNSSIF